MTELHVRNAPLTTGTQPLARCCPQHDDWPTLTEHLVREFPEVSVGAVVRETRQAKDAVTVAALDGADALDTAELIARHQLLILSGRSEEIARLDPERHVRVPAERSAQD